MTILDKIVAQKRQIIAERQARYPIRLLEDSIYFNTPTVSLSTYLKRPDQVGIIAEYKRKSPSKGIINAYASVSEVSVGYMRAGASALSVLTDTPFFGGKNEDLIEARRFNFCPILRKDFIISEYQIIEARSIGADAVLLIAACLSKAALHQLAELAHSIGLEVLVEVHSVEELERLSSHTDVVGVNNRNLKTFEVSIQQSLDILPYLPNELVKISESGLRDPQKVATLRQAGFEGFLIGEYFMQAEDPGAHCRQFIQQVRMLTTTEAVLD